MTSFQLRRTSIALAIGVLVALPACAPTDVSPEALAPASRPGTRSTPATPEEAAIATITAADIHRRVAYLASDALRGRATPSPGLDSAAVYLAAEYRRISLDPGAEDGSFIQRYPLQSVGLDTTSLHFGTILAGGTENQMLAPGTDFFALPGTAPAGGDMNHGRIVYAGTVSNGALPAGSYQGTLLVVRIPGGYGQAWYESLLRTRDAAREAGAVALAAVVEPSFSAQGFAQLSAGTRAAELDGVGLLETPEIAVFVMTDAAFRRIAAREGQIPAGELPAAHPFQRVEAHFAAQYRVIRDDRPPNVVAVLRGSDPVLRNEYVVLSAHMDHVGVGEPVNGDSIYNGADDDASGTASLVEVAEAMATLPERPRRSIIFLHVSGEELGLLGSQWYSDNPTVPIESIVANINMDMIGRNSPDSVVVIGKDFSSLGQVANEVQARHPDLRLTLADDIWPEEQFFFRSDHFNFARKEIPSLFFFSGVHEDYHEPSDEIDKLDADKAMRISRMIFHILTDIANDPQRPQWDPAGLAQVRALTGSGN